MSFLRSDVVRRCLLRGLLNKNKIIAARPMSNKTVAETRSDEQAARDSLKHVCHPTDREKKMMVWVGRYKSIHEVPDVVPYETLDKAKNKMRIKICNYMIVATAIACVVMAVNGKKAAESGESVSKMNQDWHKEYNAKMAEEEQAKK